MNDLIVNCFVGRLLRDQETNDESFHPIYAPHDQCFHPIHALGPCTSHLPLLALNKVVEMSVDQLHNLLFTENHQWHEAFIVSSNRSGMTALLFGNNTSGGGLS